MVVRRFIPVLVAIAAVAMGWEAPAAGAIPTPASCAVVKSTPDGFLAVRTGPDSSYPEIDRLMPGQVVGSAAPSSIRPWVEVDILLDVSNGKPRLVRGIHGYAHGRYLESVSC